MSIATKVQDALARVARRFRYRSAKTGRFTTKQDAERHPSTTVRERADEK